MRTPARVALTIITALAAYYFTFWVGSALMHSLHPPPWLSFVGALLIACAVGRNVWLQTTSSQKGLFKSIVLGAVVLGGIGFSAGFLGPILFAPDANQGPLLGIFFTGPLGFLLGGLGGAVVWIVRRRRTTSS